MNISILGSWNKKKKPNWQVREYEQFVAACKALGQGVVHGRHILVVDEDATEQSATWHAFRGVCDAMEASAARHPCVCLIDPYKNGSTYQKLLERYKTAFITKQSNLDGRERRRTFQLIASDTVVFLGGASSTYNLGRAACAGKEHVVCIGSFGGAAERLLQEQINTLPADARESLSLRANPWNKHLENELLALLGMKDTGNILIIHGRGGDEYHLKNILQNDLGLPEPIILKDVRGSGLTTLPEKFEKLGDRVHAAIALVTADDIGGLIDKDGTSQMNYRARQNVWLEVGWFWGRLGRERVLLLCKGRSEIPSNLSGVLFESYNEDLRDCRDGIIEFVKNVINPSTAGRQSKNITSRSASESTITQRVAQRVV